MPQFSETDICIVPNAQGEPVDDARSLEDHEALANFIMTQVRELTANPAITLHASLAGGRKTMTFYLGYAMSLFGRINDKLSHVLISKDFENNPSFWYPSAHQAVLRDREGKECTQPDGSPLLPKNAQVTLTFIPFIRQRANLPAHLKDEAGSVNLRDLVRAINLAEQPEDILLSIDIKQRSITIHDRQNEMQPVTFQPGFIELAFYLMMAQATRDQDTRLTRPKEGLPSAELATRYINSLLQIYGLPAEERADKGLKILKERDELHGKINPRTFETLNSKIKGINMDHAFFSQRNNDVSAMLQGRLPPQLEALLIPKPRYNKLGKRQENAKSGGYGIGIPPQNIHILGL